MDKQQQQGFSIWQIVSCLPPVLHVLKYKYHCLGFFVVLLVGTDLSAVIKWVGLELSAAEPHAL